MIRCPEDNSYLKIFYAQDGEDDFITSLICINCGYEES